MENSLTARQLNIVVATSNSALESLQKAKKFRALKQWNKKEQKWMDAVNHTVSRRIICFAQFQNADVVIEDQGRLSEHHEATP